MAKVNNFVENAKKAFDKAKIIYADIVDKCPKNWYWALKQAWKYVTGEKKGELTFQTSEGERITIKIEKVIDEAKTSLVFFIQDTVSNISYTLHAYQLV